MEPLDRVDRSAEAEVPSSISGGSSDVGSNSQWEIGGDRRLELDGKIESYISKLANTKPGSPEFNESLALIHAMGNKEIRDSASISRKLLRRPGFSVKEGKLDQLSSVSQVLNIFRDTVEYLDPQNQTNLLGVRKLWGVFPIGSNLESYFQKFKGSQDRLNAVIQQLLLCQDEIRKDMAAIDLLQSNLSESIKELKIYVYFAKGLDGSIQARWDEITGGNGETARKLAEEHVYYLRQKLEDLLSQLAVTTQGYMALILVRKNNLDLIQAIERAVSTTISALRVAILVAKELTQQKLMLDRVAGLNQIAGETISSISKSVKDDVSELRRGVKGSSREMEKLTGAFEEIYESIKTIEALETDTVDQLRGKFPELVRS